MILFTVTMILTVTTAEQILLQSNLKPNLQKTVNREYGAMSFRDYYAIDVLDQVQEYIYDNFGGAAGRLQSGQLRDRSGGGIISWILLPGRIFQ